MSDKKGHNRQRKLPDETEYDLRHRLGQKYVDVEKKFHWLQPLLVIIIILLSWSYFFLPDQQRLEYYQRYDKLSYKIVVEIPPGVMYDVVKNATLLINNHPIVDSLYYVPYINLQTSLFSIMAASFQQSHWDIVLKLDNCPVYPWREAEPSSLPLSLLCAEYKLEIPISYSLRPIGHDMDFPGIDVRYIVMDFKNITLGKTIDDYVVQLRTVTFSEHLYQYKYWLLVVIVLLFCMIFAFGLGKLLRIFILKKIFQHYYKLMERDGFQSNRLFSLHKVFLALDYYQSTGQNVGLVIHYTFRRRPVPSESYIIFITPLK